MRRPLLLVIRVLVESRAGVAVRLAIARPVITGLVVSGRVDAGIGAELGAMKVTEQIDAMEASAVDPNKYLAATRVLACVAMLPLLTPVADFCGILMGWIATTLAEPISLRLFMNIGTRGVTFNDFLPPTFKTAVYGLIIGLVSAFRGCGRKAAPKGSADPPPVRWSSHSLSSWPMCCSFDLSFHEEAYGNGK